MHWEKNLLKRILARDNIPNQKANSAYTMREGSKFETVEELKEELQKKELRNRIAKMDEKAFKQKIFTAISGVGSFLLVTLLFSKYLLATGYSPDLSAALSVIAGFFAAFLIMAISGIIKEFSIKSGFVEVRSILEQKIENVQINVEESKKEVERKIQEIDNRISNMNQNQNMQQLASSLRMGMNQNLNLNLSDEQMRRILQEATAKVREQVRSFEDRDTEEVLESAPTESLIRQQTLEEDAV